MNDKIFMVSDYGAEGNGATLCTFAIQRAIDEAGHRGGVVVFPPGHWLSGSLIVKSGVTLHLEAGAVLQAATDPYLFPHYAHPYVSRADDRPWRAFLFGLDIHDVSIEGKGEIQCNGADACFQDHIPDSSNRPYGIHLVQAQNVRLEHLRLQNAAHWMVRLFQCRNVTLRDLDIYNHCNLNNDGIDIDSCEDVVVQDCVVDSSDDAICIKSEGPQPSRRIRVERCRVSSHASALKVGTGSVGGFHDIHFRACAIVPSRSPDMLHCFNYWKGMSGMDVAAVDGGFATDITFEDIDLCGTANPLFVRLGNRNSTTVNQKSPAKRSTSEASTPATMSVMSNLVFRDIRATELGPIPAIIAGYENHPIQRVTIERYRAACLPPSYERDVTPNWDPKGYPCARLVAGSGGLASYGFHLQHIRGLSLSDVTVTPGQGETRPQSTFENVES